MKCIYFDINLLGIIISSCVICICVIFSYFDCQEPKQLECNSEPTIEISNQSNLFNQIISSAIVNSKSVIKIAANNFSSTIFRTYYKSQLSEASKRGVKVTILISESLRQEINNCLKISKIKVISSNTSMGFAIIDKAVYIFNEILNDASDSHSLLTTFYDCDMVHADISSFYDYQIMKINQKLPYVIPIKQHAKTSVTRPMKLPIKVKSNNSNIPQTFYFFHNPISLGDPLRISTSNLIQSTIFYNSNKWPKDNVSLFTSLIPPYTNNNFSFYQTFTRVLMANTVNILYLIPKSELSRNSSIPWLSTTAAFENAQVYLYNEEFKGPNFIVIGNRAFVFSHPIDDNNVQYNLGLHYSTNSSQIVNLLLSFFKDVYANHSTQYKISKAKKR